MCRRGLADFLEEVTGELGSEGQMGGGNIKRRGQYSTYSACCAQRQGANLFSRNFLGIRFFYISSQQRGALECGNSACRNSAAILRMLLTGVRIIMLMVSNANNCIFPFLVLWSCLWAQNPKREGQIQRLGWEAFQETSTS